MKKRWMLALAGLLFGTAAATAQVQVFQGPSPGMVSDGPTGNVMNGNVMNTYQPMPRGVERGGSETAMLPYSAPPMHENHGNYGTNCAWDDCGTSGSFYGGVGVSWLMPVWQRNPAFARAATVGNATFIGTSDYTWGMRTAPSAFVGYRRSDGLGLRARWWQFDQNAMVAEGAGPDTLVTARPLNVGLATPVNGGILAESGLAISVYDLELTHDLALDGWTLTVGIGGRYVHTHQEHNTYTTTAASTLAGSILSSHNFIGGGPTMSLGARHNLFGGLVLYGVGRGSLLFGPTEQTAFQGDAAGALVAYRLQNQTTVLPVLELEAGLEWGMQLGSGRVFVQTGFVGQSWFGLGSASRSTGFDTFDQSNTDLGLVGFTVRTGVQY